MTLSLKDYRVLRGLSVTGLGRLVGVHRVEIWRWETGRRVPSLPHLVRLARVLGASLDELVQPLPPLEEWPG